MINACFFFSGITCNIHLLLINDLQVDGNANSDLQDWNACRYL